MSAPTPSGRRRPRTGVAAPLRWCAALLLALAGASRVSALGPKVNTSCECGMVPEDIAMRIVGGTITFRHTHPWMAAIIKLGKLHCGGSLINNKYVLTAGHCLKWSAKDDLVVVLGMHDRFALREKSDTMFRVKNMIVHERFESNPTRDINDIGLILLDKTVSFNEDISPICLPHFKGHQDNFINKWTYVTGWGRTWQNGDSSRYLLKANVTIMAMHDCYDTDIGENIIDSMICAYDLSTDACQGDSGGPLIFQPHSGKVELLGVVSWGIGCAKADSPGVYTYVPRYVDWIMSHTSDAIYCLNPV